jgi:hypothetical protein
LFVEEAGSSTTPTSVGMTSGMNFPQVESRVAADRLSRSQLRCPEGAGVVDANRWGSLRLEFQCTQPGWISLEAALEARELTLEADTIEHYFDEIQASAALRAQWQELSATQPWRERYRKHARLLLWQGSGSVAADWPQAGAGEWRLDPVSAYPSGDADLVVVLRHQGQAVAAQPVQLLSADGRRQSQLTTADGRVSFEGPVAAPALVYTTILRWSDRESMWLSDFVTLTWDTR